jgi:hypothetical protein
VYGAGGITPAIGKGIYPATFTDTKRAALWIECRPLLHSSFGGFTSSYPFFTPPFVPVASPDSRACPPRIAFILMVLSSISSSPYIDGRNRLHVLDAAPLATFGISIRGICTSQLIGRAPDFFTLSGGGYFADTSPRENKCADLCVSSANLASHKLVRRINFITIADSQERIAG